MYDAIYKKSLKEMAEKHIILNPLIFEINGAITFLCIPRTACYLFFNFWPRKTRYGTKTQSQLLMNSIKKRSESLAMNWQDTLPLIPWDQMLVIKPT